MRLSTRDFWAMTPRELAYALGLLRPRSLATQRADLTALMLAFPDEKE